MQSFILHNYKTMIIKLLSRTPAPALLRPSCQLPKFRFSTQQPSQAEARFDVEELDKAANFYRNSIRRINVDDKGRGKFTEHNLLRLTKLTEKGGQVPLLFEAYYNYLGHFTVISSTTVDKMLEKAMSFEASPLESVLEVFENHPYLAYFPHYRITQRLVDLAAQSDPQFFQKLLRVFLFNPLIKFDQAIVDKLLDLLAEESTPKGTFSSITKVLLQRSVFGIIDQQISPSDLLKAVASALGPQIQLSSFKRMRPNQYVHQFITKIRENEASSEDLQRLKILEQAFKNRAPGSEGGEQQRQEEE